MTKCCALLSWLRVKKRSINKVSAKEPRGVIKAAKTSGIIAGAWLSRQWPLTCCIRVWPKDSFLNSIKCIIYLLGKRLCSLSPFLCNPLPAGQAHSLSSNKSLSASRCGFSSPPGLHLGHKLHHFFFSPHTIPGGTIPEVLFHFSTFGQWQPIRLFVNMRYVSVCLCTTGAQWQWSVVDKTHRSVNQQHSHLCFGLYCCHMKQTL